MGTRHRNMSRLLIVACIVAIASAEVYFEEDFSGDWESRWTQSKAKADLGKFQVSAGKFYGDAEASKGLQTSQDAKFYGIMAKHKKDEADRKKAEEERKKKEEADKAKKAAEDAKKKDEPKKDEKKEEKKEL